MPHSFSFLSKMNFLVSKGRPVFFRSLFVVAAHMRDTVQLVVHGDGKRTVFPIASEQHMHSFCAVCCT